jgi:holo-[acyl-carrier protein] synthase
VRGIGIDVLDVDRFEQAITRRPGLITRLFADAEIESCARSARPARHLAARFCAKEAAVKALSLSGIPLRDLVVEGGFGVSPKLTIAPEHGDFGEVHVSISHERGMAAAVVMAV